MNDNDCKFDCPRRQQQLQGTRQPRVRLYSEMIMEPKRRVQVLHERLLHLLVRTRDDLNLLKGKSDADILPTLDTAVDLLTESLDVLDLMAPEKSTALPAGENASSAGNFGKECERPGMQSNDCRIRVMLVDDHAVMRQGLSELLSDYPDIAITGEASDGEEAIQMARKLDPDVILMDISMPKMNGIEATRIIHKEHPGIRVIGLSMFDAADQATAIEQAGATDYLRKSGDKEQLIAAIRRTRSAA